MALQLVAEDVFMRLHSGELCTLCIWLIFLVRWVSDITSFAALTQVVTFEKFERNDCRVAMNDMTNQVCSFVFSIKRVLCMKNRFETISVKENIFILPVLFPYSTKNAIHLKLFPRWKWGILLQTLFRLHRNFIPFKLNCWQ